MATISNPASFSSVRSAFNSQQYGISSSFLDYRQGGPIVPFLSRFNSIGAGLSNDPLQLSQFSGFFVPALITSGTLQIIIDPFKGAQGYTRTSHGYSQGAFGSIQGKILGADVNYCFWETIVYTGASPTDYRFEIELVGNYSSSAYAVRINGTTVTNAKTGSFGGTLTTFVWDLDLGDTLPSSNPFGSNGTVSTMELV